MNIALTTKALTSALTTALAPATQPTLDELLAPLQEALEDAEARLYCAEMHSDFFRWQQERDRWQGRVSLIKKQIKLIEEGF